MKYGLIAGNGRFPLLALESARGLGHDVVVVAIQEEAAPEVEAAEGAEGRGTDSPGDIIAPEPQPEAPKS